MKRRLLSTLVSIAVCCTLGLQFSTVAYAEDTTQTDTQIDDDIIDYSSHDIILIYLGDNIFYRLIDDYFMYGSTEQYYLEDTGCNIGDIIGIDLADDNVQSKDYEKNLILESSYNIELIQESNPVVFEDEIPVFFGSVNAIYSDHSMQVILHGEQDGLYKFYINTTDEIPSDISRGSGIVFTVDKLYSMDNATVITSDFVSKSDYISSMCVGYNSEIDASVLYMASTTDENIGRYIYLYGVECEVGYQLGIYYLPPFTYLSDNLYVADFYEVSSVSSDFVQEIDDSNAIYKEGTVLGRYSDNGAYVKLSEADDKIYTYIYLANGVPDDVEVGDMISFDLLNSVNISSSYNCYYADNVEILEKKFDDILLGDVNLDGSINILDFLTLKRYILYKNETLPENADINRDNSINTMDLLLLRRMILGLT